MHSNKARAIRRRFAKKMKDNSDIKKQEAETKQENSYPDTIKLARRYNYNFWNNKPVPKFKDIITTSEIIEEDIDKRKVYSSDEIKLPESMQWQELSLDQNLDDVCNFLNKHYESQEKFRTNFTPELVRWMLLSENSKLIFIKRDDEILGIIGTTVELLTVHDEKDHFVNVKLLCVNPMYRKKKMVYSLIDEMARRLIRLGFKQAYFMTDKCVPTPTSLVRFYYRPINYINLQKTGYFNVGGDPEAVNKKFMTNSTVKDNVVQLEETHMNEVFKLYTRYMTKFNVHENFNRTQLQNLLLNKFVRSFVIMKDNVVLDFFSYQESLLTKEDKQIVSGTLFLYTCLDNSLDNIIRTMISIMEKNNVDLFNISDFAGVSDGLLSMEHELSEDSDQKQESKEHVYEHKFVKSSKKRFLNFFNWKCPETKSKQIYLFSSSM